MQQSIIYTYIYIQDINYTAIVSSSLSYIITLPHHKINPGHIDNSSLLEITTEEINDVELFQITQVVIRHVLQLVDMMMIVMMMIVMI